MKKPQILNSLAALVFMGMMTLNQANAAAPSAEGPIQEQLLDGKTLEPINLAGALARVTPGSVVVLGEQHAHKPHQLEQLQVIETLKKMGKHTSVGMEFFTYTNQPEVDAWRNGDLAEAAFLSKIGWGNGFSFDYYRDQVQLPEVNREFVVALNAPRTLTGKVAKTGLDSLTEAERALLPPNLTLGNARYFERFKKSVGHLPSPEAASKYFAAQSIWDDTMAWRAEEFLAEHSDQILVIIVGEFHVQYGGGLPDRLKARGIKEVTSISLVNLDGLTAEEEQEALAPSPTDGPRADFIFASKH